MAVAVQPDADDRAGDQCECREPVIFECFSTLIDRHQGPAACFTEQEEYISTLNLAKLGNCVKI